MANSLDTIITFGEWPVDEIQRPVAANHLLEGDPLHTVSNYYVDQTDQYRSGVWESTPGKWKAFAGRNEFCHMLSGIVRLTDLDGNSKTYRAGDSFMITPDFDGTWEVLETAKKLYVIFEDHPAS